MTENTDNRRAFHRIFFDAPVSAIVEDAVYSTKLLDISLNGALIVTNENWEYKPGDKVRLEISLGESHELIVMETVVAHVEKDHAGLKREQIDMDSISHLRRLVELNLGDSDMLSRELEHLISPEQD